MRHYSIYPSGRLIFMSFLAGFFVGLVTWLALLTAQAATMNGFDIDDPLVPETQIFQGGPPRDGIPAIDHPQFISALKADFMKIDERVLGIYHNHVAKAYAIRILNYHEIVNDTVAGDAVVITFCPLCGTGMAFNANVTGKDRQFGVSGLLYNSDMLLYDRESMSLWSQIMSQAINGPMKGTRLQQIPILHTSWANWLEQHPDTLVLSTDTGFSRDYDRTPYPGYTQSSDIMFPVSATAAQYHPKEQVLGIEVNRTYKAYPFVELAKTGKRVIEDSIEGVTVKIIYDAANQSAKVLDVNNAEIASTTGFWFAWFAFHPDTMIFTAIDNK